VLPRLLPPSPAGTPCTQPKAKLRRGLAGLSGDRPGWIRSSDLGIKSGRRRSVGSARPLLTPQAGKAETAPQTHGGETSITASRQLSALFSSPLASDEKKWAILRGFRDRPWYGTSGSANAQATRWHGAGEHAAPTVRRGTAACAGADQAVKAPREDEVLWAEEELFVTAFADYWLRRGRSFSAAANEQRCWRAKAGGRVPA
jgi:hypothetical protein